MVFNTDSNIPFFILFTKCISLNPSLSKSNDIYSLMNHGGILVDGYDGFPLIIAI
ncbi:MAG: hypothetical protein ACJA08_000075 [Cyclobacteriaceae bacterium]|jgi:hypothetical protein